MANRRSSLTHRYLTLGIATLGLKKPLAKLEEKMKKIINLLVVLFVLVFGNAPASARGGGGFHSLSAEELRARDEQRAREIETERQNVQQEKNHEVFLFVGTLITLSLGGIIVLFRKRHDLVKALQSTENGVLGEKMKAYEKALVILLAGVLSLVLLSIAAYNGFDMMDKVWGTQSLLSTMKGIIGFFTFMGGIVSMVVIMAFTFCLLFPCKSATKKEEPVSA